jgi:hypothetical protein
MQRHCWSYLPSTPRSARLAESSGLTPAAGRASTFSGEFLVLTADASANLLEFIGGGLP